MSKRIIVNVNPIGKATVEADGFQGQGCEAATKGIEDALAGSGSDKVEREYKTEWAEMEQEQQEEQHQQL